MGLGTSKGRVLSIGGSEMRGLLQTLVALAVVTGSIGCSSSSGATSKTSAAPKADPDIISTAEIDSQSFRDAYDVVQRLRPTWFTRKRGSSSTRGMATPGSGLVVYLDNARLGGIEALRQLNTSAIESLRFMDAATATANLPGLGSSVIAGAIVARSRRF
jgi:hypothetical protein